MMIDLRLTQDDKARLEAVCRRFAVRELALFGSAARGELREHSDLDLLVTFEAGTTVTFTTLTRLQRELAALFGRPVDLVPKTGLKRHIRDEVLGSSRVLYAA